MKKEWLKSSSATRVDLRNAFATESMKRKQAKFHEDDDDAVIFIVNQIKRYIYENVFV